MSSRRDFFKKAAIGGVSIAGAAGVVKLADSAKTERDLQAAYLRDVASGDRILQEREYVVMTAKEKEDMVRMFEENYRQEAEVDG